MGWTIPGIGSEEDYERIETWAIRGFFADIFDFKSFVEGPVGNMMGISRGLFCCILFFGMIGILWEQIPNLPTFAFEWVVGTAPLWVLPISITGGWKVWVWYSRATYLHNIKPILLDVKFPRDLVKSPRAMETALTYLWLDSGETTFYHRIWKGQVRQITSLEIASFGGDVHFYVWCWRNWLVNLESALYAQYPEVELHEVEDYATKFKFDPKIHQVYCTDWRYEPRNDAYQLRTYLDYELERDPKEEYKVDPLAQVVERMANLKPSEQMWLQIIIQQCKDVRRKKGGKWYETEQRYVGLLSEEINKIRKEATGDVDKEPWRHSARIAQFRQVEQIKAIDRHMGKLPFNVGMRGVYIADEASFGAPGYTGLRWIWRAMANPQWGNQMRPRRWHNPFDYPWQDLWDLRRDLHSRRFFDCYRRRGHFYAPWILPHNMMSCETLATLWHPPSRAIATPGLERVPAKKAAAPSNLPM